MKEKFAALSVLLLLVAVPLGIFGYRGACRVADSPSRAIDITGVASRGAWTLEAVNGLNYWWKSFEPATVHLQLHEQVVFRFFSADVFHQFYVPELGIGPVDVDPGRTRQVRFTASRAGVFRYYCTSQCGSCHFYMQGWIVVTPPGETPVDPQPVTCRLCLPAADNRPPADAAALGEYLYQAMGCVTCHGFEGRGGVANYNYLKGTVPAHDNTAAKLFLTDAEDRRAFVAWLHTAAGSADPPPPDIARARLVHTRFQAAVALIRNGKNAARLDMAGPEPPLQMPAWEAKLSRRQIFALLDYFISLFPDAEAEADGAVG